MPEGVKVFWPLSLTKLTFQTKTVFGNWGLKGGISIDADSRPLDAAAIVLVTKFSIVFWLALVIL